MCVIVCPLSGGRDKVGAWGGPGEGGGGGERGGGGGGGGGWKDVPANSCFRNYVCVTKPYSLAQSSFSFCGIFYGCAGYRLEY